MKPTDYLNMNATDIAKMNTADLTKMVKSLQSITKGRMTRLRNAKLNYGEAYHNAMKNKTTLLRTNFNGGRHRKGDTPASVASRARGQLIQSARANINFLRNKTSKVSGMNEVNRDLMNRMHEATDNDTMFKDLGRNKLRRFWKIYDQIKDEFPYLEKDYPSNDVQQTIFEDINYGSLSDEEILADARDVIKAHMEMRRRSYNESANNLW